jgi:ethanolamine permease
VSDAEVSDAPPRLERSAGALLLWGLGVGYVISGDFFGWNFGLAAGGFGGMAIAIALMATLYTALIFTLAELATMMPVAGGPYAFARRALGPWGGFATGLAVTIEYVLAPAVIATGIGGYVAGMFAAPPAWLADVVPIVAYAIFVGISLLGSRFSLGLLLAITIVSVAVLLAWSLALLPHVDPARWFDVAPQPGGSRFLPHGPAGIVAALPAAGWFYLAVEGVPLAAEETRDPARALPRGMIAAMLSLLGLSLLTVTIGPGVAGTQALASAPNPLPAAVEALHGRGWLYWLTTVIGLLGLVASFFAIIFAYSRQIFALARAGYLPRFLARTNRHHAPHWALVLPAMLGYLVIVVLDRVRDAESLATPDLLMQMAVFAALLSYAMMLISHFVLRRREPDRPRPYRTPGYPLTPALALALVVLASTSTLFYGGAARFAVSGTALVLLLGLAYFALYSRHHLVASAPEEEAALIAAAERELE